ncbi:hypothetical protein GCM10007199_10690 [Fictibacillus barbaricus]|nr:hypothetical protein GCM10007199_10690 [Fictibacillus barbaricus]
MNKIKNAQKGISERFHVNYLSNYGAYAQRHADYEILHEIRAVERDFLYYVINHPSQFLNIIKT